MKKLRLLKLFCVLGLNFAIFFNLNASAKEISKADVKISIFF
jgi:hypothetical protein